MTEVAIRESGDTLALTSEQSYWNGAQLAALRHMGVEDASDGDLTVFHHVCTKTGLDPFARQIYMIGRNTQDPRTKQWGVKYTIQTGIDGFRLIGRRAANRSKQSISITAPEWAADDGTWRPVWRAAWGVPVAARVVIKRDGEPFEAVALFDEYKQTKKDGGLTSMWTQRPAGQIAKCAEALAWRMAFPQDLSGIYTDDEMGQADRRDPVHVDATAPAADRVRAILGTQTDDAAGEVAPVGAGAEAVTNPADAPAASSPHDKGSITPPQLKKLQTCLRKVGVNDRDEALAYYARVTGNIVESSKELSQWEAGQVIEDLERAERGEPNVLDPASANDPARADK